VSRPTIAVTSDLPEAAMALLAQAGELRSPPGELSELARGAAALVTQLTDRIDGPLLDVAGPQLRVVANVAVGYDNIDVPACAERGVAVSNTPGVLTEATADIALALILMATRRLGEGERLIRSGTAWRFGLWFHLGSGLAGKTLGLVGFGQIGQATARRARGCGMEIAYTQRRPAPAEVESSLGARYLLLDELLATSDVVSLHCPLTPETRHLIGPAELAAMKPTAFLVNTARGPIVDEEALVTALRAGTIAGAGLDVYEHEPALSPGLAELENLVLLPHLGSATVETRTAMAVLAARNVAAVLGGDSPLTPVA
jgi:glyoxylate reductase